jgi:RNA polymerase sigma factor (sigma-70 family)
MSDYRVEVKVKNNNLLRKIEEAGYSCVGEFCRRNGHMQWASTIGQLVNLKKSPIGRHGKFIPIVEQICQILLCSPEDLFSDIQMTTALETNHTVLKVNEAEMRFMLENKAEPLLLEQQVHKDRLEGKIEELLHTLTPREAKVISMRFGVGDRTHAHTLIETAELTGVTRERIRQIEAKALRKLRHPSRAECVRDYIEEL